MRTYNNLQRQSNSILIPIAALALCILLSGTMLFSRLATFVAMQQQLYIPLTESNGVTKVTSNQRLQALGAQQVRPVANGNIIPLDKKTNDDTVRVPDDPIFKVEDENTVWEGQTQVEIFRVSYENGEGKITVQSGKGDKVIAPGTSNEYAFTLKNTGKESLDYTLEMEAYFSNEEFAIPVVVRLLDYQGTYLLGNDEAYTDVLDLNQVNESGSLSAGYIAPYTLQWQWPFEGDDAYDTLLGNMAVDEDLTLTIVIRTVAEYGGEGGMPPYTGDSGMMVWAIVMVASFAGLLLILLLGKDKRKENPDHA